MNPRAAVLDEPGGRFQVVPVSMGDLRDDEVLVRVAGVGICHTDLAVRDRVIPVPLPAVLGHEAAGIVEQVGSAVQSIAAGDAVVLSFLSCGACRACSDDRPGYCDHFGPLNFSGRRADGTTALSIDAGPISGHFFGQSSFATHAIASERNAVRIETDLPLELLGPLGCGFLTGAGTVMNSLDCSAGSTLAVFGVGPVGMAAVMAAKARGCREIVAIDNLAARREIALEYGATRAIDPASASGAANAVRQVLPGGVDFAIDTTGASSAIEAAIGALAKQGTCALVAAPRAAGATVPLQFGAFTANGTRLIGVMEGDCDPHRLIPELLSLHRCGAFPFDALIRTYPFGEIERAIAEQGSGACVKAVLVMERSE